MSSSISGTYRISNIQVKTAKNGNNYLKAALFDASGSINMVCWEYDGLPLDLSLELVYVVGTVGTYQDSPQFTAESFRLLTAEACQANELKDIVPCAPVNVEHYKELLNGFIDGISNPGILAICQFLFDEHWNEFVAIPAAQIMHHAFLHGLLMHTVDTLLLAEAAASSRPGVNRDLLIGGVLLYDIGKLYEFEFSPCTGLVTGYSEKGHLLGHAAIGFEMIGRAAESVGADPHIANQLQYMVLSHHNPLASASTGQPQMAELELLRRLDAADSGCERCLEGIRRNQASNITSLTTGATYEQGLEIDEEVLDDGCF